MKRNTRSVFIGAACLCGSLALGAEMTDQELTASILAKDKQFWVVYNTCEIKRYKEFFTDDIEFYHDKGGPSSGFDRLVTNAEKNLCTGNTRLRREVVAGTERVFPLRNGGEIYGAILSGEHVFYVLEKGKAEFLDGRANFTHLWLKKDGSFKMARILSFNHRPAVERGAIQLTSDQLDLYTGTYKAPKSGDVTVTREGDLLAVKAGSSRLLAHAENSHLFYVKERDLTFDFQPSQGKGVKMIVREHGQVVEEALREQ